MNKQSNLILTPQNASFENQDLFCKLWQPTLNSNCPMIFGVSLPLGFSPKGECNRTGVAMPEIYEQWLQSLLAGPLFDKLQNHLVLPQNCIDTSKHTGCFCSILPACPNALVREYIRIYGGYGNQNDLLEYLVAKYKAMIK